ncbi:signal recognition particle, SRP9/SRP14 subunit [Clavulina sp. PMI_390]|nr:signal recognition particle, SRP9/SRP14 subunit [Clavulina sp. PMI_390]
MYIKAWDEFQAAAEALYAKEPVKTRYSVKWRSSEGLLVLKVTDDTTCLKYKTRNAIILNRFDALTLSLMRKMQNGQAPPPPEPGASSVPASSTAPATGATTAGESGALSTAANAAAAASGAASGGVKKKKPKKKK